MTYLCYLFIGQLIAANSHVYGSGLYGAEAGVHGQFVIQLNDVMNQTVTRGGAPITITVVNEECCYYLRVHDNNDGSYFVHYVLHKPGEYALNLKLNDEHHIAGSPFTLTIMPSKTVPENCTAVGDCLTSIVCNTTSTFTIHAKDIFHNHKVRGGDPFELGVMGPAQLKSLQDNSDGTCKNICLCCMFYFM